MKINRTNIGDHLVDYQLSMIGKTVAEAYKTENWFSKWTMTTEQHQQLKAYAIPLIKKVFKCNRKRAEGIFDWFVNAGFALKINDDNENLQTDIEIEEL